MGRFSELDILLSALPRDREDPIFAHQTQSGKQNPNVLPEELSIWDLTDEELVAFISGAPTTSVMNNIIDRVVQERRTTPKNTSYIKKRG